MNKRALQVATFILALVPIATGIVGMLGVDDPLYAASDLPRDATLDSNLRFFGGVWCGLGLAVMWTVPRIDRETALFRAVWLMIFIGGLGRVVSLLMVGPPFVPFIGFIVLEIIGAPFFVWQQAKLARNVAERGSAPWSKAES